MVAWKSEAIKSKAKPITDTKPEIESESKIEPSSNEEDMSRR